MLIFIFLIKHLIFYKAILYSLMQIYDLYTNHEKNKIIILYDSYTRMGTGEYSIMG